MEIAGIIIGTLALVVSLISLSWQLGKHWSTHVVQLQSAESIMGLGGKMGKKIGEEFKEFDVGLDAEEEEYFKKQNQ